MDHACTIEARLQACENTGRISLTKSERWILSEWMVACDRVSHFKEKLIDHRLQTPFAEVDLLFQARDHLIVVEVKSFDRNLYGDLWHTPAITKKQLSRLAMARESLSNRYRLPVRLLVAVVSHPGREVDYFDPMG